MTTRSLGLYLVGAGFSFSLSFDQIREDNKRMGLPLTYGNAAFISIYTLSSWAGVGGLLLVKMVKTDFWNTPIGAQPEKNGE